MKYILNEPFLLRGWRKLPYALVDARSGLTEFFRRDVMDALLLCDGRQEAPGEGPVRKFLEKLEQDGVIRPTISMEELYISAEGRALPCTSLSGQKIQGEAKKRFDREITDQEAQAWLDAHPTGELSDEELKNATGGSLRQAVQFVPHFISPKQ